jgi:signal transduction histidine kinase
VISPFSKFFSRLTLAQQIRFFVGFLLSLEIAFVAILGWQVVLANQEADLEERHRKIVADTQSLQNMVYECVQSLGSYAKTREKSYSEEFDVKSAKILKTLDELKKMLGNNPKRQAILKRIDKSLRTGVAVLIEGRHKFESEGPVEALKSLSASKNLLTPVFKQLLIDVADLQTEEQKIISKIPHRQKSLRGVIISLLLVGLVGNILLAIALARFFSRAITSRLALMVDNTERFKRGSELNTAFTGVDEIAKLDQSFHQMAEEVAEAQRMKQTFVAMISHDLRTPLTSVNGYLQLLADGVFGEINDKVKTGAQKSGRNVDRLIRLINDLLDLEKMEAGKMQMAPKAIYIENAIEKSIESVQEFADSHKVSLVMSETDLEVLADPDRIVQVLINLISNAVKFSPPGESVEVSAAAKDQIVEISIQDHGRGVPEKFKTTIFEKYKQVEKDDGTKKGGTGLGLPICKMIVEQLGGQIGVESEEGKGSRFWFTLPRISGEVLEIKQIEATGSTNEKT